MLWWTVQNTLTIIVLAAIIALVCRAGKFRPSIQHALWLVVLVKFAVPTVVVWPWSVTELCTRMVSFSGGASNLRGPHSLDARRLNVDDEHLLVTATYEEPGDLAGDAIETASGEDQEFIAGLFVSPEERLDPSRRFMPELQVDQSSATVAISQSPLSTKQWIRAGGSALFRTAARVYASGRTGHLLVLWGIGAAVLACWELRQIARCRRVIRNARSAPPWLLAQVREVAKTLRVGQPQILIARGIPSPFVWCAGRPKLVWPETLTNPADQRRWRGVIAHELAHLRRGDHWVAWIELVAGCIWWWNPLFWYVRGRVRETSELACDAWAVWTVPDGERDYAETLLEVTRLVSKSAMPMPSLGVTTGARRSFERRLTMILSERVPCKVSGMGIFAAGLLALFALPAWSLGQSQPLPAAPTDTAAEPQPTSLPLPSSSPTATTAQATAPAEAPSDGDRISRLERQLELLLQEVRAIRGSRGQRNVAPATSPSELRTVQTKEANGIVVEEVWSGDKIVSKRIIPQKPGSNVKDNAPGTTLNAITTPSGVIAVSPDKQLHATIAEDGQIVLIDTATGRAVSRIDLSGAKEVRALSFSPDGRTLDAVSHDGKVIQLETTTGKVLRIVGDGKANASITVDVEEPKRLPATSAAPTADIPAIISGGSDTKSPPVIRGAGGGRTTKRPPTLPSALSPAASATTETTPSATPSVAQVRTNPNEAVASSVSPAAAQLDLIRLATEYSDALGNLRVAQHKLEVARRNLEQKIGSETDAAAAAVNVETTSSKVRLLRAIAESASDATKAEVEFLRKLTDKGYAPGSQEAQASAKLRILQLILSEDKAPRP